MAELFATERVAGRVGIAFTRRFVWQSVMPKRVKKLAGPEELTGSNQIAEFLGPCASVVQRWAAEGMPAEAAVDIALMTCPTMDAGHYYGVDHSALRSSK